ncbi:MAG: GntR family transcriptional regulator [Desulfobacteraceae bacterium]|nr:GntR family transcriptional regulator [Desulfobacteraceae bacterium]
MTEKEIQAIKTREDIHSMRFLIQNNSRDLLLFDLITQTGIPVKHLLQLQVNSLKNVTPGELLEIPVPETEKHHRIRLTGDIYESFRNYLKKEQPGENEYIFKSRKGDKPLMIQSVSRLVKGWFEKAGFTELNGVLSLHKTWELYFKDNKPEPHKDVDDNGLHEISYCSVQEEVYSQLLQAIISTKMKPGEKIVTDRIAKKMNVSRIPVREALKRLETKGLIYTLKNRGLFVSQLSVDTMRKLVELRLINEKAAVYNATNRRDTKLIGQLEHIHQKYIEEWEKDKPNSLIFHVNREFHFALYQHADNQVLMDIISMLWDRFTPYLYVMIDQTEILSNQIDIDFHEGMLNGVREKNPRKVFKWLEADIYETVRILEEYFRLLTVTPGAPRQG